MAFELLKMEMLNSFMDASSSGGYVKGGAILDTNDSDGESDTSGQGVFDYDADVVSLASAESSVKGKRRKKGGGNGGGGDRKKMTPRPGGAFCALTPSMWPQDILTKFGEDSAAEAEDPDGNDGAALKERNLNLCVVVRLAVSRGADSR